MAFLTVEDLAGSVEVIVFPKVFEEARGSFEEEAKVLITGRASGEEEKDAKLIADSITPLEEVPKKLWIRFDSRESYEHSFPAAMALISGNPGKDLVTLFLSDVRAKKELKERVSCDERLIEELKKQFGRENIRVV